MVKLLEVFQTSDYSALETVFDFGGLFDRPYDISKSNIFQSCTPKADFKENVIFERKSGSAIKKLKILNISEYYRIVTNRSMPCAKTHDSYQNIIFRKLKNSFEF